MGKFIKATEKKLTGVQKAAIILAELGPLLNDNYDVLMEKLNLSADEMKKIRIAMKNLGEYRPAKHGYEQGMAEIKREQSVLKEVLEFGRRRGIYTPPPEGEEDKFEKLVEKNNNQTINNITASDPEMLANILKLWIEES